MIVKIKLKSLRLNPDYIKGQHIVYLEGKRWWTIKSTVPITGNIGDKWYMTSFSFGDPANQNSYEYTSYGHISDEDIRSLPIEAIVTPHHSRREVLVNPGKWLFEYKYPKVSTGFEHYETIAEAIERKYSKSTALEFINWILSLTK